jgi:glycosyltransferase involved in cell wall biosynthesis
MPKILRIINRFNLGGPTYNVSYLSRYMSPEYETLLVGGEKEEGENSSAFIPESMGIHPMIIPELRRNPNFNSDREAYKKIKHIIRDFKPDIVHTHASKAGALGRLAASSCKVPVIIHTFHGHVFHSYFGKTKTAIFKNIERYLAKRTTAIVAISEIQKKELVDIHRIAPAEKIHVINLGFDLDRFHEGQEAKRKAFREFYQVSDEEVVVVIIGRMAPVKNHELFIRCLGKALKKTTKKVRAFVVGDGETRQRTEVLAKDSGIDFTDYTVNKDKRTLTFTSWITDVDRVLAGAEIVCLSSFNEGTPVSLIEAQAAGKPIISTKVGGIEDIVSPETALLCAVSDEEKFAQDLLTLIEREDLRASMGKSGWEFVHNKFHYKRLVKDTQHLYESLLR